MTEDLPFLPNLYSICVPKFVFTFPKMLDYPFQYSCEVFPLQTVFSVSYSHALLANISEGNIVVFVFFTVLYLLES